MSKKRIFLASLVALVIIASCAEQAEQKEAQTSVQQSELAKLMRQMEAHGDALRVAVINGNDLPEKPTGMSVDDIVSAERTPTMTVHEASFPVFSEQFENGLDAIHSAAIGDRKTAYNSLVQSCSNCHQMNCPGPLVKIETMFIQN